MPIGDPMGGEAPESERGRLRRVQQVWVPVTDLDAAVEDYTGVLHFTLKKKDISGDHAELLLEDGATIVLYRSKEEDQEQPGIRTGVVFSTDSIYDFHKDMVDEGVDFTLKPMRDQYGRLIARFTDSDGNEYEVIEMSGQRYAH